MKRRNFLTTIAGILSAPFASKASTTTTHKVVVDPASPEPDRHSVGLYRIDENGPTLIWRGGIFETQNTTLDQSSAQLDLAYARAKDDLFDSCHWYGGHIPRRF